MKPTHPLERAITELIEPWAERLDTRRVLLGPDALERAPGALERAFARAPLLLAADERTWEAAGTRLGARLDAAGARWERFPIADHPKYGVPLCDDAAIAAFGAALRARPGAIGVAVGAGTINDIVKFASFKAERPCAVVASAPSMNGYTSAIAAVLSEGVKTTRACRAPALVIADSGVLTAAPARMIASGLGDLLSKPVSNADWALSAALNQSAHSSEAAAIIERGAAMLEGVAPGLGRRDQKSVEALTASLMLSGVAMSVAGSSSPASGGEHLISHFIDMTAYAFGEPHDLHGCQVGVGTMTTALLYERLFALDPATIDPAARAAAWPPWSAHEEVLRARFGPLFDAVSAHAEPGYPEPDRVRARLEILRDRWESIRAEVGRTLRSAATIRDDLIAALGPTRYAELGVTQERAERAVLYAKDIRNRYTILHLTAELGALKVWGPAAVARIEAGLATV